MSKRKVKKLIKHLGIPDYIAICAILGGFILLARGIDHEIGGVMVGIISYYFGHRVGKS